MCMFPEIPVGGRLRFFVQEWEKNNTRSVDSVGLKRSKIRFHDKTSIFGSTTNKCQCSKRIHFIVGGRKIVTKGCNRTCAASGNANRFLLHIFRSPKDNERLKTDHKFKTSEQVSKEAALQNGLSEQGHKLSTTRRLGNFDRFGRCLSTHSNSCEIQKVSTLLHKRKSVPIHMSLLRSNTSTKDIYQNSDSNCSTFETAKCPTSSLSRRLVHNKSVEEVASVRQRKSAQSSCQTRSYDQARKISTSPKSKSSVHRGSISVGQGNRMSNIRENSENSASNIAGDTVINSSQFSSSSGLNGFMHRAYSKCSVIHETDTTPSFAFLETCNKRYAGKSTNNAAFIRPHEVVEKQRKSVTREAILPRGKFENSDNRCLQARLWRSPRKSHLSGHLVKRRQKVAYKPSRTENGSLVSTEISVSPERSLCSSTVRQHNGCSIPESSRRHKISSLMSVDMEPITTSNKEQCHNQGSSHNWEPKLSCRRSKQSENTSNRMDSKRLCDSETVQVLGTPMIDLFASEANRKMELFCSWIPSPKAWAIDALSVSWQNMDAYVFPPIALIPKVLQHMKKFRCQLILIAPQWPRRHWYTDLLQMLVATPMRLPLIEDLLYQPKTNIVHPNPQVFNLTARPLSTDLSKVRAFHQKLENSWQPHGELVHRKIIQQSSQNLVAGVVRGKLIPIQPL